MSSGSYLFILLACLSTGFRRNTTGCNLWVLLSVLLSPKRPLAEARKPSLSWGQDKTVTTMIVNGQSEEENGGKEVER